MWLSPRTIHFGTERLFWECGEKRAFGIHDWQNSQLVLANRAGSPNVRKKWRKYTADGKSRYVLNASKFGSLYRVWNELRTAYVNTSVTYEKDKLVALSGLASAFQDLLGDEYLAGLWRKTLIFDMLWVIPVPRKRTPYRAPSWSWASMEDGRMWFSALISGYPHEIHELCRIVHAEVTHSSKNKMGEVSSGHVLIEGYIFLLDTIHGSGPFQPTKPWPPKLEDWKKVTVRGFNVKFDEDEVDPNTGNYLCIHLLLENHHVASGDSVLHGLVLKSTVEGGDAFERAGYFSCSLEEESLHEYLAFLDCACSIEEEGTARVFRRIKLV
jgi:hypothetical protein